MGSTFLSLRGPDTSELFSGGVSSVLTSVFNPNDDCWLFRNGYFLSLLTASQQVSVSNIAKDYDAFYYGACNQFLWPLFHGFTQYVHFQEIWWDAYRSINLEFATALTKHELSSSTIFINDYQLLLVPGLYARQNQVGTRPRIFYFHHIPWSDLAQAGSVQQEILDSLLACDVLGFQTTEDRQAFLTSLSKSYPELVIDQSSSDIILSVGRRKITVKVVPVGVNYAKILSLVSTVTPKKQSHKTTLLSIDRLDYIKGIAEKLTWFTELLHKYPNYRESLQLLQVINPTSRISIPEYLALHKRIAKIATTTNQIELIEKTLSFRDLIQLYRSVDCLVVSSVKDGMNLISKEFVAANHDQSVTLLLSEGVGARKQLGDQAFLFKLTSKSFSRALTNALALSEAEKRTRVMKMNETLAHQDCFWWIHTLLA